MICSKTTSRSINYSITGFGGVLYDSKGQAHVFCSALGSKILGGYQICGELNSFFSGSRKFSNQLGVSTRG